MANSRRPSFQGSLDNSALTITRQDRVRKGVGSDLKNEPNVLQRWNLFTIDAPLLWGQYRYTMDWLLIATAFAFAIVTILLCVGYSRSGRRPDHRERVIICPDDGSGIEPSDVAQFSPTWRNERRGRRR